VVTPLSSTSFSFDKDVKTVYCNLSKFDTYILQYKYTVPDLKGFYQLELDIYANDKIGCKLYKRVTII
jgi:hypothetical protein